MDRRAAQPIIENAESSAMDGEHDRAASRLPSLAEKFQDKRYRDGYVAALTRSVLARQMRNFRGDLSQAEFGAQIGKRQTVISRLESPAYAGWSLRTMLEVARKRGIAVFVRFVDFPTFLKYSDDLSDEALCPQAYDQEAIEAFAKKEEQRARETALPEAIAKNQLLYVSTSVPGPLPLPKPLPLPLAEILQIVGTLPIPNIPATTATALAAAQNANIVDFDLFRRRQKDLNACSATIERNWVNS